MGFYKTVKLLLVSIFVSSCLAVVFGGLSLNGSKWLVNEQINRTLGLGETLGPFFTIGFSFQMLGMLIMGMVVATSVFSESFEQRTNIYMIVFIMIMTLFVMGFAIMLLSAFKLVSEPKIGVLVPHGNYKLSLFKSQSFIYFMVNILWSLITTGLVSFSLGYMEINRLTHVNEDSVSQFEYTNRTLSKNALLAQRNLTQHQVPDGIPVPNAFSNPSSLNFGFRQ